MGINLRGDIDFSASIRLLLGGLGIKKGDVIYLGLDMGKIPFPVMQFEFSKDGVKKYRDALCHLLYQEIMDFLGPYGTILVGTFTYKCSNPLIPFIVEKTSSELGPFTEWIRMHPESVRSLHPIFSVAGVGAYAKDILLDVGGASFGQLSPFGRFSKYGVRFVNLGIPFRNSLTYIHHLEQSYGCHHRYNKLLRGEVWQEGRRIKKDFYAYLRWRGINMKVDVGPFEELMKSKGVLKELTFDAFYGQSACAVDLDVVGYEMLKENSCCFLSSNIRIDINDQELMINPTHSDSISLNITRGKEN